MTEEATWIGFEEVPQSDKIEQLDTVYRQGFISRAEYEQRRRVVLDTNSKNILEVRRDAKAPRKIKRSARKAALSSQDTLSREKLSDLLLESVRSSLRKTRVHLAPKVTGMILEAISSDAELLGILRNMQTVQFLVGDAIGLLGDQPPPVPAQVAHPVAVNNWSDDCSAAAGDGDWSAPTSGGGSWSDMPDPLENARTDPAPVHVSSLVFVPPRHLWPKIQEIRRDHDKGYARWMPHVTLLYPFLPEDAFAGSAGRAIAAVKHIEPFEVVLSKAGYFAHGRNNTMWLQPECPEDPSRISDMQYALDRAFPTCDAPGKKSGKGFRAHLTLGQFPSKMPVEEMLAHWDPQASIRFTCKWVFMISRRGDEPFEFRHAIPLGSGARQPHGFTLRPLGVSQQLQPVSVSSSAAEPLFQGMNQVKSSTLVIVPPPEQFAQFVEIKSQHMNPRIKRRPYPHITLRNPFVSVPNHDAAALELTKLLGNFPPFRIDVKHFKVFDNGKSQTLYLDPVCTPGDALADLAALLQATNFDPHIGIAFTRNKSQVETLRRKYQKSWVSLSFMVNHIFIFHRRSEVDDFKAVKAIPLGSKLGGFKNTAPSHVLSHPKFG